MAAFTEFSIRRQYSTDLRSPVRWILSHTRHQWYIILFALFGAAGNAAMASVPALLIGDAMNQIQQESPDLAAFGSIAIWIALSQLARSLLMMLRNFGFEIIAQRIERQTRNELYVSLLGKNMTFHSLQSVGDIMARATNDVREVNMMFSPGVNLVLGSIIFLFVPLFLAPDFHPQLIFIPAVFIVIYFTALARYLHKMSTLSREVREAFGIMNTRLSEALDGIEVVKGAARESDEVTLFSRNIQRYRTAAVIQGQLEARFIPPLLLNISIALGLFHAVLLHLNGMINLGQIAAYAGVLIMLGFPTFTSQFAYTRISLGVAGARRILELINTENVLDQNLEGYTQPMVGKVEFVNASFQYPASDKPALHQINFTADPGTTIAVVGQTGYGKTTLVRLINRTYDCTEGSIRIDGVDVRNWKLESLRRNISMIEQDIFLFSKSIAENIAFGCPGASFDEVIAAAKAAQAHDFIMELDKQYDTVVGERGATLSGGQRQRIALARAFLTKPRILILDDSTSAIDSATEDKIQQAIFEAAKGRTTFIITHRLSQIRWADHILVLKKGQLVASGTHLQLMAQSQAYRNIFSQ